MYRIERRPYGYHHRISGHVSVQELDAATEESRHLLAAGPRPFCVFVDMRGFTVLSTEEQKRAAEIMVLYKRLGMLRSVVVLDNPIATLQLKRLAKESGIDQWERYLDASIEPLWESKALAWLTDAIEPA
jgi:hypothetical protein